ncbi:MAG: ABC transporter permease [Actinobacteria bacterium]|nr:MAG: ABC transporter permease [Actinomycetota bacterium]
MVTAGLADTLVLAHRNLRRLLRTPRLIVLSTVQPVLFFLLYLWVFGGAVDTPGMSYLDYLMPAVVVQAILTGGTTAVAVAVDLHSGMVDRFRSLPIDAWTILAGRTIADLTRAAFVTALLVGLGFALGYGLDNDPLWILCAPLLMLVFAFLVSWLLVLVGVIVGDPETAQLAGLLLLPLLFASSAFVPISTMPDWLQPFAENQPVNVAVTALRTMTQGGDAAHWAWLSIAWAAAGAAILIPVATIAFGRR